MHRGELYERVPIHRGAIMYKQILTWIPAILVLFAGIAPENQAEEWGWPNTLIVVVEMEIDPDAAREWLPVGVELAEPYTAKYFVADYPESECCGPYRETAILLPVIFNQLPATHCSWMLVDDDVALVQGRDIFGYPKKMGEIRVNVDPGTRKIHATVDRQGSRLISIGGTIGEVIPNPDPLLGGRKANVWGVVPAYGIGGLVQIPRILTFETDEEVLLCRDLEVTVQIQGTENDPIDAIQPGVVVGAMLYRTNMGSGSGLSLYGWEEVDLDYVVRT